MALRFTLRQLEYFVAVGEAGSILIAAEKVNVSSPSISAAICQLEGEFGLQLFVRKHAKGLALSQAGRQFMVQAKEVLLQANGLNQLAGEILGNVQGPLAVGCLLTFAQLIVPQLRRKFETRYPDVRVSQYEMDQSEIFNSVRNGKIDLALTYDLEIPSDLTFLPLAVLPPYAIFAQSHPLAHLAEVSVDDLISFPMILLDLPFSSDYFLSFFKKAGSKPIIAERTRDMAVMRSLVGNGFGYGIANIRPMNDLSPDGSKLCFVPLVGTLRPMTMGLVMSGAAQNVLTVRKFADHCRQVMSEGNVPGLAAKDPTVSTKT